MTYCSFTWPRNRDTQDATVVTDLLSTVLAVTICIADVDIRSHTLQNGIPVQPLPRRHLQQETQQRLRRFAPAKTPLTHAKKRHARIPGPSTTRRSTALYSATSAVTRNVATRWSAASAIDGPVLAAPEILRSEYLITLRGQISSFVTVQYCELNARLLLLIKN